MPSSETSPEDRPWSEERIALTPRKRQVYDALWTHTRCGTLRWAGALKIDRLNVEQITAAVRRLGELGCVRWEKLTQARRYEVLVTPARIDTKDGRPDVATKLREAPAIAHELPKSVTAPRSFTLGDPTHNGVRLDDGRFSAAFSRAFAARDYSGLSGQKNG